MSSFINGPFQKVKHRGHIQSPDKLLDVDVAVGWWYKEKHFLVERLYFLKEVVWEIYFGIFGGSVLLIDVLSISMRSSVKFNIYEHF